MLDSALLCSVVRAELYQTMEEPLEKLNLTRSIVRKNLKQTEKVIWLDVWVLTKLKTENYIFF